MWMMFLGAPVAGAMIFAGYFVLVCLIHTGRWPWERR